MIVVFSGDFERLHYALAMAAGFEELFDACVALKLRIMVCETGLRADGVMLFIRSLASAGSSGQLPHPL